MPETDSGKESRATDADFHRKMGVDLFNGTWELLEKPDRTPAEDDRLIDMAHASRYHWSVSPDCRPVNLARGAWLIARVYAVLEHPAPALFHARRCLALSEEHGLGGFDIAFAHEAMARSLAAMGDQEACARHYRQAHLLGMEIQDPNDRAYFFQDLDAGQWFGLKPDGNPAGA